MPTKSERAFGIRVESLGKLYRITPQLQKNAKKTWPRRRRRSEQLWALRDVSFELARGSTLGIIGRNGAGKTTLLSILCKVTTPTEGRALIAGKASALLEVGTGFHGDLTGRENVFLNGAILGMSRREIERKFDEIVAFAEIERFIDTPVKRYSSGMTVRLAFAVAAHLEPDVLLIDEVLSVGDASFQQKCLGKIGDVTSQGRTVVLVSHNLPTIASFAQRCLWLDRGTISADGPPADVIREYLANVTHVAEAGGAVELTDPARPAAAGNNNDILLSSVRLLDREGDMRHTFFEGEPINVEVTIDVGRPVEWFEIRAYVKTADGFWLFASNSGKRPTKLTPGRYLCRTRIEPNHLRPGSYRIDLGMQSTVPQDGVEDAIRFNVEHDLGGDDDPVWRGPMGHLRFDYRWDPPKRVNAT
ncbi:MAG: ABC transporter ATP-binding protein [Solirubrobacteraceae bacterium]